MSRIGITVSVTAALLISTVAFAWGWEAGSRLMLVTSNGSTVVGVGAVDERSLALTVVHDFSGFAVLVIEAPDGSLVTLDVVVDADGSILVSEEGNFIDLGDSVAAAGLEFQVAAEAPAEPAAGGRNDRAVDTQPGNRPGDDAATGNTPERPAVPTPPAVAGPPAESEKGTERAVGVKPPSLEEARESAAGDRAPGQVGAVEAPVETEVDVDVEGAGDDAGIDLGAGVGGRATDDRD